MPHPSAEPKFLEALTRIGQWLKAQDYQFVTPTPLTHQRILKRARQTAPDLRDVFGWNRPFGEDALPAPILHAMQEAQLLERQHEVLRSRVRFSSLDQQLYAHSSYPTSESDAVFFGPDTYRFVNLIRNELAISPLPEGARILDVGCGAGPGGMAAALTPAATRPDLVLADINTRALAFARANASLAGLQNVEFSVSDLFAGTTGEFDLIVANPPYLVDGAERTYRHGGGPWGSGLSERIVAEAQARLAPGGRLVLYTGVAIVDGVDRFRKTVASVPHGGLCSMRYQELDPDVFGEELETAAYGRADRIAAVALVLERPRP
jgi:methylase of polypeptide subunit release factors